MVARWIVFTLLIPVLAFAQDSVKVAGEGEKRYSEAGGCIGGDQCGGQSERIRIRLDNRPVVSIRFTADDDIGPTSKGKLRVKIDDRVIESSLDIPRDGQAFKLDVDGVRGSYLTIEPAANDEVNVDDIEVVYGSGSSGSSGPSGSSASGGFTSSDQTPGGSSSSSSGGWTDYSSDAKCIGGKQCRDGGKAITVKLDGRPVASVRIEANDDIGDKREGILRIKLDGDTIASHVDIKRVSSVQEFDGRGKRARELRIEAASDDEVAVTAIAVKYGSGGSVSSGSSSGGGAVAEPTWDASSGDVSRDPGCIGGERCGGSSKKITVPLENRQVRVIRFNAHDNVGRTTKGALRIKIDGEVLEDKLDIEKAGREYEIDGEGLRGRNLIIEAAANDEVVVSQIRVVYR